MIECGASTNKSQPKVSEDPDRLSRQHSGYIFYFQIGTWRLLMLQL